MPNELKTPLNASTTHTSSKRLSGGGSSSITAMVWTLSGMVLAACGSTQYVTRSGDGDGGGATVIVPGATGGPVVRVVDGPVKGAAVYFDLNGDGQITQAERDAQTNEQGRPFYVTDENGEAQIPEQYENVRFVAVVSDAIDTATGEVLDGEYHSLANGVIASPLTDLLAAQGGSAQATLNDIFGMDQDGNPEITLADVLNHENYKILDQSPTIPTEPTPPTISETDPDFGAQMQAYETALRAYQQAIANTKIEMITKAALALSEIDGDVNLVGGSDLDTPSARVNLLKNLFDGDPSTGQDITDRVTVRENLGRDILDGKPVAAPDPYINIQEDNSFSIVDYMSASDDDRINLESLFGFVDPGQNAPDEVISAFRGIYISGTVANGRILFNGQPLNSHQTATGDLTPSNLPSESGFYYVSFGRLSDLSVAPDEHYFGELNVEYYVFDGIDFSQKATLSIDVASVNDAPVFTGLSGDRDPADDSTQFVLSEDGKIVLADGTDTINNFERGVDKLVLVDVDGNPLDLATFISEGSFYVAPSINADSITSVEIVFTSGGLPDGPGSSGNAIDGKIVINFKDSFVIENAGTKIDQGRLTDLSLLANYFGEGFDEGLQVITPDQLGVEVI